MPAPIGSVPTQDSSISKLVPVPAFRVLSGRMLRVSEAVAAIETLPELLRLEEDLNSLNQQAAEGDWDTSGSSPTSPKTFIPRIPLGGRVAWADPLGWWKDTGIANSTEFRDQLVGNFVFQREILAVCLRLVDQTGYPPLRDSLVGRLRDLSRRRAGLPLMTREGIARASALTAAQKAAGLRWDADAGVPYRQEAVTLLPFSTEIRLSARRVVESFLGLVPVIPATTGEKLLEDTIRSPGRWDQMCSFPPPVPMEVPMPVTARLASRSFTLDAAQILRLQAFRDLVVPQLAQQLGKVAILTPQTLRDDEPGSFRTNRSSREFGPLLFEVVGVLNAVECLPDLLRLEQQFHDLLGQARTNTAVKLYRCV